MITLRSASSGPAMLILPVRSPPVRSRDLRAAAMSRRYSGPRYRSRLGVPSLMLCFPLASGAPPTSPSPLHCAAFPRRSFVAPQSRRRRAPSARSCVSPLASGAPPTSPSPFTAPPSLVAPQSRRRRAPSARSGRATMCGMAREDSLTDDEQPVLFLHPHWKTLIRPLLVAVIVVAAALVLEAVIPSGSGAA